MLYKALSGTPVFKRADLVALSGMRENTLKSYLHFFHARMGRTTEVRRATLFTAMEAMTITMMAIFQNEWGMRPEQSYATADALVGNFVDEMESQAAGQRRINGRAIKVIGGWKRNFDFPKNTCSAVFEPGARDGIVSLGPSEFNETFHYRRQVGRLAAILVPDAELESLIFAPVVARYKKLTGVDILAENIKESRRNDATSRQ